MVVMKVRKIDVARRQLDTAVRLYFSRRCDPVSMHTLTMASYEVLAPIYKHRFGSTDLPIFEKLKPGLSKKDYRCLMDSLKEPQNFFKHGTKDRGRILEWNIMLTLFVLSETCRMYQALVKPRLLYRAFMIWLLILEPRLLETHASYERNRELLLELRRKGLCNYKLEFFTVYVSQARYLRRPWSRIQAANQQTDVRRAR